MNRTNWYAHVKASPNSMLPIIINGCCLAWRSAMGTDYNTAGIIRYFKGAAPKKYWPKWVKEI